MKRILALIMVLAMVFAFAACKSKDDGATTTDPSSAGGEVIDNGEGSTPVDASAADSTEAGGKTPAAAKTVAEIVADYVKARKATKPAPAGKQTMALGNNGKITGDGGLGGLLKVASPIINNVLKKNSTDTDYVPASSHADLKASDVKSAKAIVSADGKYTDYIIYVKDQTDGPNGDSHNGGPVARGVGTLGSIDEALNQLGAEFKSGKENVKLTYTNAYIFSVEGWPHLDTVTPQLKAKGIKNVTLMPLMMVAGDHANNDMAGDEPDSFKSQLQAEGFKVNTYIHGLGENAAVQKLFVERANDSWDALQAK